MKVKPGDWNGTIIRLEPYTWDQNATCRTGMLHVGLERYMQNQNHTHRTRTMQGDWNNTSRLEPVGSRPCKQTNSSQLIFSNYAKVYCAVFIHKQLYVAVARVTSRNDIRLLGFFKANIKNRNSFLGHFFVFLVHFDRLTRGVDEYRCKQALNYPQVTHVIPQIFQS